MIIKITGERPNVYTYSGYKLGWVLEVIEDFGNYYTACVLTGNVEKSGSVIAVHKDDCETLRLHKEIIDEANENEIWMVT